MLSDLSFGTQMILFVVVFAIFSSLGIWVANRISRPE